MIGFGCSAPDARWPEEAKLALQNGDTALARTLLDQCPKEYRNSSTYRSQVDMYDTMCHKGILCRRNSEDVMGLLCSILRCDSDDTVVRQYCDRLMCNGYNHESIQALTMGSVDLAMQTCHMSPGHRCSTGHGSSVGANERPDTPLRTGLTE